MNLRIPFLINCILICLFASTMNIGYAQQGGSAYLWNWQSETPLPSSVFGVYNDVWGIEVNGKEYGVIGSTMGVHFISLDDADSPKEVAFVAGADQGPSIAHRDYHSYQNYLYTVADEGNSTLQVIDFSGLPESVEVVYDSDEFFQRAHNIFIDEANARLYTSDGIRVLDLTNPEQPVEVSHLRDYFLNIPFYAHDIFIRDNILYINGAFNGFAVVDYNDVENPFVLGTMPNYANSGYNHSGWLSDDGDHYFMLDETGGSNVKTVRVDDFTDIEVVDFYKTDNDNPEHIAHNAMVKGDRLFVSYYSDGLQVFDITDPEDVKLTWNFDTFNGCNDSGFKGAWGIYALLPSGRILVSDLQTGLYLLTPPEDYAFYANGLTEYSICSNEDLTFQVFVGNNFEENGVNLSVDGLPDGVTASFDLNPAPSNTNVKITLSGWDVGGIYDVIVNGTDGVTPVTASVQVELTQAPTAATSLVYPEDGAINIPTMPTLEWTAVAGQEQYQLELSLSPFFNIGNVVQLVTGNSFMIPEDLALGIPATYYWRVSTFSENCDNLTSEVQSFTTGNSVATNDLEENEFKIYPNPAKDFIVIGEHSSAGIVNIQLLDINGRLIQEWNDKTLSAPLVLEMKENLNGVFILKIADENGAKANRVILEGR